MDPLSDSRMRVRRSAASPACVSKPPSAQRRRRSVSDDLLLRRHQELEFLVVLQRREFGFLDELLFFLKPFFERLADAQQRALHLAGFGVHLRLEVMIFGALLHAALLKRRA